jgi:CRP-like cAMP-binding protein
VILNNFASRYKNRGIFDEKEITDSLPPQLKLKVAVVQYFTHVDRAPFFMGLGFECLAMICSTVEHLDVSKETSIYEEGDMGTEMYFIMDGEVEVESQGVRLGYLSEGAFFGESAVIDSVKGKGSEYQRRIRTVRATMPTELGVIRMECVTNLFDEYPQLKIANLGRLRRGPSVIVPLQSPLYGESLYYKKFQ